MKFGRMFCAALLLVLGTQVHAQSKTKATIGAEITNNLPDNNAGAITPAIVRGLFNDLLNSYFQGSAVNAQTGTSYTVQCADMGALLTFNNASPVAVTLPGASNACFNNNWAGFFKNIGGGAVTITPSTGTINGAASITFGTGQGFYIASDGTNYQTWSGALSITLPLSVSNGGTGLTSGTSGGIPYYSGSTTMASSAALTQFGFMIGGGAGASPTAIAACTSAQLAIGQASANPACRTVSGDLTIDATGATTLATVNANVGAFGNSTTVPTITLDGKGRATAASQTAIPTSSSSTAGLSKCDGTTITCPGGVFTAIGAAATAIDAGGATSVSNGKARDFLYQNGGNVGHTGLPYIPFASIAGAI